MAHWQTYILDTTICICITRLLNIYAYTCMHPDKSDITRFLNMHVDIGHCSSSDKLWTCKCKYINTYIVQHYRLPRISIPEQLYAHAHTNKHNLHYSLSGQEFCSLDNGIWIIYVRTTVAIERFSKQYLKSSQKRFIQNTYTVK